MGLPLVIEVRRSQPDWADINTAASVRDGYVGAVYACGDVLVREQGDREPVRILSVIPTGSVPAKVVAVEQGSRAFDTGAAVFSKEELPDLGLRDVRGLRDDGDRRFRYLVLMTPDAVGEHRVPSVKVRYRKRFLAYEATSSAACEVNVTEATGTDPRGATTLASS